MKTIRHNFLLCLALITFCNINAQKKKTDAPKITFDCAKSDNSISVSDIQKCKKLILKGAGIEGWTIIEANVNITQDGSTKNYKIMEDLFTKELSFAISKLTKGSKITIKDILIKDDKVGVGRTLEPASLNVK